MISLLKDISISSVSIIVIISVIAIVKELLRLIKAYRSKAAELVLEKELNEFDKRIEEFYLPLRERFRLTKLIANQTSKMINKNGDYDNSFLNIESHNPRALRDIIVLQIFLPLNTEIEHIILNEFHWKHPDDDTNYEKILQHYIFWRALENARMEDKIKKYDATNFLAFPQDEVDKHYKMCDHLLNERNEMRNKIKYFRNYTIKQRGAK